MKLLGLLIPTFRKGTSVIVEEATCARGAIAENLFRYLDPNRKYKGMLYGSPKRGAKGLVVSLIKYKEASGETSIYCGVLIKEQLYAIEESRLTRA
ncbi:hypothetical protein [Cohnella lupini]|uniref:Uncharacterized protein n=1 Tax=Cohnella lupini TaxID=1294267 RepID=A0A3D9HTL1_9BACL|nr:hypothetical protein [Cohnella lupini]RED52807.1 hypothetical protein DFP95_13011 [Cohnella lupini]